ncbi:MAG: hypothetical protein Q4E55_01970 [Bacteroidales bacterium]|nr:hypothetical protein [Bacteroidales bacterium]
MKKTVVLLGAVVAALVACTSEPRSKVVEFDSSMEVSGEKFAIGDITAGLPMNWDEYNYVVLEYKITTAQRFHVGFTTADGYNELRVMCYVPGAWNKLAIPLKFFRQEPGAAVDLAATYNQPRYTGWINLGGKRGALHRVDSIGFRMRAPIGNPRLEIRSISLSVDDPGDSYLENIPAVDEFGQWNLSDYEGKIHSLDELRASWAAEDALDSSTNAYNYSRYGGYRQKRVQATGYFRTEKIDGKWWFVDPEGYLFLSHGVDCVSAGGGGQIRDLDKREKMYKEIPPMPASGRGTPSFGRWNLQRRYGDDFREKANEQIIRRMNRWGLNTIANWSGLDVVAQNKKAFMLQLRDIGIAPELMGLADVYSPSFHSNVDSAILSFVAAYRDNPWLIGYFLGNEPAWLGRELQLCQMILEGKERPIKKALQAYLSAGDTEGRRIQFVFDTFDTFIKYVNSSLKKNDPNHLNLGIRFGNIMGIDKRLLISCKDAFDVLSFNCYSLSPDRKMLDFGEEVTGLPMIVGEYHFGTVDRGMAQSLWQVESQAERGVAYRYYTENAFAHPNLIGTAYFQWCDQDFTGRFDGENYNCGLIDVTDRPYSHQVEAMSETSKRLFGVHSGSTNPFSQQPVRPRGHGGMPEEWIVKQQ